VIILDTSQSMEGQKLIEMLAATQAFLNLLARDDEVTVYVFNDNVTQLVPSGRVGDVVESLSQRLDMLFVEGNTALYDAVCTGTEAVAALRAEDEAAGEQRLYGIVLLSDGQDTNSNHTEAEMLECLPSGEAATGIKVFTIAYGEDADENLLLRIANRTNGRAYTGNPETLEEIYIDISFEQ
jgi:Ca-activated chloride channel family protein